MSREAAPRTCAPRTCMILTMVIATVGGCTRTGGSPASDKDTTVAATRTGPSDTAFSAMQARGASTRGMGVDQYTSVHVFDALPDGGRIELQRGVDDSAGVAQIRRHLHQIATAFAAGDFRTPEFVHMAKVPGTDVMAARRRYITYAEHDLPRGGEVRITTRDRRALAAIHDFLAYQRSEHHAGGMSGMSGMHDTTR